MANLIWLETLPRAVVNFERDGAMKNHVTWRKIKQLKLDVSRARRLTPALRINQKSRR